MARRLRTMVVAGFLAPCMVAGIAGTALADPQQQVSNSTVSGFPTSPQPSTGSFDWAQRAKDYDAFVYDWQDRGSYTTIQTDTSALNMPAGSTTFKMPAYYGDTRVQGDAGNGNQEAVTQIASVVGATLVGVDKSDQDGKDYVDMLRTFYHPDLGVAKDTPSSSSSAPGSQSIWYTTVSNVLYYMLGDQYPDATDMTPMLRSIADQYYAMLKSVGGANADITMQDFDFATGTAVKGRNEGGEAAAGAAAILLWAHAKFGDSKYLEGAEWAMDALQRSNQNLYYEVIPILAPYIAARMNAEDGTDYDVSKYIGWLMAGSNTRRGWGTITGTWGGVDVSGLSGSKTDCGPKGCTNGNTGYAFAMNSFATPLLAATAKYDARYADTIGRWMLNVDHAARYFYADQLTADQQYWGSRFIDDPAHVIAYEGLTTSGSAGIMALGDVPDRSANWGVGKDATSLGLYGSSWVGFMGASLSATNVANVVRTDLNALDFFGTNAYPTYLYYNPNTTDAKVSVALESGSKDLYDSVSDSMLATGVSGTTTITVPAGHSVVLVEVPAGATRATQGSATTFDGTAVAWNRNTDRDLVVESAGVTASSSAEGSDPSAVADGDTSTLWTSGAGGEQSLTVDLGAAKTVSRASVVWGPEAARAFRLETSEDGVNWSVQTAASDGSGGGSQLGFPPVRARYVRLVLTEPVIEGAAAYSVRTLEVNGSSASDDLALNQPTTASSIQNTTNKVENATDGDASTRWESKTADPQWLQVDLGKTQDVGRVVIAWETAAAMDYTIDVSDDGNTWTTAATVQNTTSPVTTVTDLPAGTTARYIRMNGTSRLTKYAYSLYSLSVYAPAGSTTLNPDGSATSRPAEVLGVESAEGASGFVAGAEGASVSVASFTPDAEVTVTWTPTGTADSPASGGGSATTWTGRTGSDGTAEVTGTLPAAGTYTVRATDAFGVTALAEDSVEVGAAPEPEPSESTEPSEPSEPSESGEPTEPSESAQPSEPAESGSPTTPGTGSPSATGTATGSSSPTATEDATDLAHTGATAGSLGALALLLVTTGAGILVVRRRRIG